MTRGHRPLAFFGLTALLAGPFLMLGALTPEAEVVGGLPLSALQVFAPFLAAVILVSRQHGRGGLRGFVGAAIDVRRIRRRRDLLPLLLIMPAIYVVSYALLVLDGRNLPAWEVSASSLVALLALFLVSGFLEEVGWTGYALDPLRDRLGYVGAALVIGVACALFHVGADLQAGRDWDWIFWQRLAGIALRVLIVVAYYSTGQAVTAAVLVHAMDNVSWVAFPDGGSHYDPAITAPVALAVAGLVLLVSTKWVSRRERR